MTKPHKQQFSTYAKGFGGPASGWKRFTKAIAWLLLLSFVANILNVLVAPKTAQAVDVNDHMLLFWPSTNCADTPADWTAVSDGGGEAFTSIFPHGAASYSASAGGSADHTHTATVTQTGITGSVSKSNAGSTQEINTHTHTNNSANVDNISSLPKYREMCVIKYDNGIPNGNSAIPNGAVAIFDAAPPAGWSDYSSTFSAGSDTFIRGGTNGTGGSNSHQGTGHTISSIALGATNSGTIAANGTKANYATAITHSHTVDNQTSDTPDTQPPYMDIYLGQKSTTGPIPNDMIAMFDDTDSSVGFTVAGWTRLSDASGPFNNRFLKVTGTYGNPAGATTHSHAALTPTSNAGGDTLNGSAGAGSNINLHTHSTSISLADGTNTNIPPYTDVVIAKKQTAVTVLTTDQADYPGLGDTITVNSTVNNYHASTNLASTYIDYVIFIDGDGDGRPDAGETYVTNNCAGSGAWASGNYTHQTTGVNVNASSSTNDQWSCTNTNFPSSTTYTLWARWWDGTSYSYNIYYDKGSVTFTSVPTLTEILFLALVGCMVFLGVRTGAIKFKMKNKEEDNPPNDLPPLPNHQGENQRSNDGVTYIRDKINDQ